MNNGMTSIAFFVQLHGYPLQLVSQMCMVYQLCHLRDTQRKAEITFWEINCFLKAKWAKQLDFALTIQQQNYGTIEDKHEGGAQGCYMILP